VEVTYGVRVYDDYGHSYINTWDSIPDDDLDVLAQVIEDADGTIEVMLDHCREHKQGLYIGGEWYDYEQIGNLL